MPTDKNGNSLHHQKILNPERKHIKNHRTNTKADIESPALSTHTRCFHRCLNWIWSTVWPLDGMQLNKSLSTGFKCDHSMRRATILTCVQPHVHFHAAWSGEALQTALTLEGLDACVCLHVRCEGTLHCESSETLFAFEGFLVGVNANVADEVAGLLELFGAVRAAVPAHTVLFPDRACSKANNWISSSKIFMLNEYLSHCETWLE